MTNNLWYTQQIKGNGPLANHNLVSSLSGVDGEKSVLMKLRAFGRIIGIVSSIWLPLETDFLKLSAAILSLYLADCIALL